MQDTRKWKCSKKMGGYLLELSYVHNGNILNVNRYIDYCAWENAIDQKSFLEYHLNILNQDLCDYLFPMTHKLDVSCKYHRFGIV